MWILSRNTTSSATALRSCTSTLGDALNCGCWLTLCYSVYSLFSALIMHVYQMRSLDQSVIASTQERISLCMNALKEVSKTWLVAKMVHTLFEFILGNKVLEDRLQKAAGKRHAKAPKPLTAVPRKEGPQKRKYDDVDLAFANGPPAPQVSYERSRPQTPSATPSREVGQTQGLSTMPAPSNPITSPQVRQQNDTLMGGLTSRSNTRPPTPFYPSFSIPSTPPDLFLVTRNSPQISQNIWDNFQPDQLFPESSGNQALTQYMVSNLDPQLSQPMQPMGRPTPSLPQGAVIGQGQTSRLAERPAPHQAAATSPGLPGMPGPQAMPSGPNLTQSWPSQFDGMDLASNSPEDSWSNSSKGPIVPTTLNVEDW